MAFFVERCSFTPIILAPKVACFNLRFPYIPLLNCIRHCSFTPITDAPKVVNINPNQSVYFENDKVNCSATGNPTPSVTWSPSGSSTHGYGYSVLTISQSMHGQAYTCAASNVIGSLDETLTIAIGESTNLLSPRMLCRPYLNPVMPVFIGNPR